SELTRKKLQALHTENGRARPPGAPGKSQIVIIDGLLGLGATHLLREPIRAAAREINQLRTAQNAFVFAVDLPTGLNADSGEVDPDDCRSEERRVGKE